LKIEDLRLKIFGTAKGRILNRGFLRQAQDEYTDFKSSKGKYEAK